MDCAFFSGSDPFSDNSAFYAVEHGLIHLITEKFLKFHVLGRKVGKR